MVRVDDEDLGVGLPGQEGAKGGLPGHPVPDDNVGVTPSNERKRRVGSGFGSYLKRGWVAMALVYSSFYRVCCNAAVAPVRFVGRRDIWFS